jgi:TP901 family phage tail tape measure protein
MAFGKAGKASGLVVRLMMDTSNFDKNSTKAQKRMKNMQNALKGFTAVAAGVGLGLGGIAAGFAAVSKTGVQLQDTLVKANALLGRKGTTQTFNELREAAIRFGSTTEFTANQAAQSFQEFARQGFATKDVIDSTEASLGVATVGMTSLGEAADFVGTTIKQFGLDAKDATSVSDAMAVVLTNTRADFASLRNAMVYAGPAARAFGQSMEQAFMASASFIEMGLDGTLAGNAYKMAMQKLQKPTDKAHKALARMNLTMADITPGMKNSKGDITNFASSIRTLSEQSSLTGADIMEIFGSRSGSPMAVLIDQAKAGADSFKKLEEAMGSKDGLAKQMREQMLNSVAGTTTLIKSAADGAMQALFDTFGGIDGPFHSLLKNLLNFVTEVSAAITENADEFEQRFGAAAGQLQQAFGESENTAETVVEALIHIASLVAGIAATINGIVQYYKFITEGSFETARNAEEIESYTWSFASALATALNPINAILAVLRTMFNLATDFVNTMKDAALGLDVLFSAVGMSISGMTDEQRAFASEARRAGIDWKDIGKAVRDANGNLVVMKKELGGIVDEEEELQKWLEKDGTERMVTQREFNKLQKQRIQDQKLAAQAAAEERAKQLKHAQKMADVEKRINQDKSTEITNLNAFEIEQRARALNDEDRLAKIAHENKVGRLQEELFALELIRDKKIGDQEEVAAKIRELDAQLDLEDAEYLKASTDRRIAASNLEKSKELELVDLKNENMEEGFRKQVAMAKAASDAEMFAAFQRYEKEPGMLDKVLRELVEKRKKAIDEIYQHEARRQQEMGAGGSPTRAQRKFDRNQNRQGLRASGQLNLGKSVGGAMAEQFPGVSKFAGDVKKFGAGATVLKGATKGAGKALAGMAKGVGSLVSGPLKAVGKMAGDLMKTFGQAINFGTAVIAEIGKMAMDVVSIGSVGGMFAMAGESQGLMEQGASAEDAAKSVVTNKIDEVMGYIDAVVQALPYIMEQVAMQLPVLINKLVEAIPVIVDAFIKNFPAIVMALARGIPAIIFAVIQELPRLIGAILKELPKIIWEFVKAIGKGIADVLAKFFGRRDKEYQDRKSELKGMRDRGEISDTEYRRLLNQAKDEADQRAGKKSRKERFEDYSQQRMDSMSNSRGSFYSGISYVPRNMKGVTLHRGERVVPAHENRPGQAEGGGMTSPSSNYSSSSSSSGMVVVQSVVDGSVIDSAVVGANADGRAMGVSRMIRKTSGKRAGIRSPGNNPWGRK